MAREAGEKVAEDALGRGAGDEEDELELSGGRHRSVLFENRNCEEVVRFYSSGMRRLGVPTIEKDKRTIDRMVL